MQGDAGVRDSWLDDSACELEVVLPEPRSVEFPEHMLWRAVLEDAIRLAQGARPPGAYRPADAQAEARTWIASEAETDGTYRWTCDVLGLDPNALRRKLLAGKILRRSHAGRFRARLGNRCHGRVAA